MTRRPHALSRARSMALHGYGWEDIVVASRDWPSGLVTEAEAREIVGLPPLRFPCKGYAPALG
jgi:hypothetical protein